MASPVVSLTCTLVPLRSKCGFQINIEKKVQECDATKVEKDIKPGKKYLFEIQL